MVALANRDEIVRRLAQNLPYLQKHFHVNSLSVFGSAAREEMTATSDVDVLVEFDVTPGFIEYMQLKFFLESLLGRNVDLVTPRAEAAHSPTDRTRGSACRVTFDCILMTC